MSITLSKEAFSPFPAANCEKIALNELVVYGAYRLLSTDNEINTENLVAVCFFLFPNRFCLRGYSEWPDSSVVNKRWVDCRDKGFLVGSTAKGLTLTPDGISLAQLVQKKLVNGKTGNNSGSSDLVVTKDLRTRAGRIINFLEQSDAYKYYEDPDSREAPTEFDYRSVLQCTMESSEDLLRKNVALMRQYAEVYERGEIQDFLSQVENELGLNVTTEDSGNHVVRGGMLPKKRKS